MANISAIKLPNNTTYTLVDNTSGYTKNTGTITQVKTTAGTHSVINVTSGAANFNVPTKTSHLTNDSGFITSYTDAKLQVAEVTSGSLYYPIVGTGTTAATRQYDTTGFSYSATTGTTSTPGMVTLTLGNSTASGTAGNKLGNITLYGSGSRYVSLRANVTATSGNNFTIYLPNKDGTVALTSDIPTISYPVTSVNSKTGKVSLTASDVGALASSTTYVSTITTTAGTHTAISSKSGAVSFNVPTKTSHLTNDSGFITSYTDEKLKISTATSGSSYYPLLGNGTSAATRQYDSAFQFSGTNGTASGGGGSTTLTLGNSTTSSTAGWRRGIIQLYGYGAYSTTIENRTSTDNRTIILPDNSGTIALTSDIPDVSGKIDTAGTGLSKSGTTLNHSNSVTAGTAGTSSATSGSTLAVPYVTYDAQGHITATGTHTHTISGFLTSSSTLDATKLSGTIPSGCYTNTTYGIATNTTNGLVKPWYTHTAASTGPTTGNNTTAVAVNTITTTASRYYAVEADSNGRLFVNVPWTNVNSSYLTGITSSQVTTALGYTPYNSTNPNGYTSNTGTVTKVTAGTGLSIGTTAGGNFTTSGTINHTNSVTAQTTQAVYPIKIDAQGHISGYGSAVTSMPASDVSSWAKASSKPTYTASEVGAAASTHAHGNITSGGDITATAPTIANGDQIIINDNSASKITNGPTFDGSTITKALTPKGTWETFLKSYTETDPTVPSWAKASSKPSYTASEVGAVPTSRTVNGKALSSNITLSASDVSALYEGTLSMSGLTAYSSRCVVSAGGYFKIGKMVFIQLKATNSGSLGSNNTWGYIDGFPIPTANFAAISAYASQNYGNISAAINNDGRLVIATGGSALAKNTDMYFAGWYMASS